MVFSVAAIMMAIAALVWGYREMKGSRRRENGRASGEASPWLSGSEPDSRRLSSQYESISDVSPQV